MTTRCWLRSAATAAALTLGLFGLANATPAKMTILGNAAPPIGHYEFCRDNPAECSDPNGDVGPLALTEDLWKQILKVNYTVNTTITPITDKELYGVEEKWAIPTRAGDCEDFALLKRKQLIDAGISPSDLLMTVVLAAERRGSCSTDGQNRPWRFRSRQHAQQGAALDRHGIYLPQASVLGGSCPLGKDPGRQSRCSRQRQVRSLRRPSAARKPQNP